jgi:hypothetical protein
LANSEYEAIKPNEQEWLWSKQLNLWLGLWHGKYLEEDDIWLRFYTKDGELVLTFGEFEQRRAELERQRAERAEAELARLRERLRKQGVVLEENNL